MIFVFGSNLSGKHGKGSALEAKIKYGAVNGIGAGRTGSAYAIPTRDGKFNTLPLSRIKWFVDDFIAYASMHPHLIFRVTRIGCGNAGYTDAEMAPMFKDAPANCRLPDGWR